MLSSGEYLTVCSLKDFLCSIESIQAIPVFPWAVYLIRSCINHSWRPLGSSSRLAWDGNDFAEWNQLQGRFGFQEWFFNHGSMRMRQQRNRTISYSAMIWFLQVAEYNELIVWMLNRHFTLHFGFSLYVGQENALISKVTFGDLIKIQHRCVSTLGHCILTNVYIFYLQCFWLQLSSWRGVTRKVRMPKTVSSLKFVCRSFILIYTCVLICLFIGWP